MKLKKQIALMIAMLLLPLAASAAAVEIGGIYYNLNADTKQAEVTKNPNEYRRSIDIPSTVSDNGVTYDVTSIGQSAFAYCTSLTSVTIPNSVTSIGGSAFEGCDHLTSVTIPNSVTRIEWRVFIRCSNLTSVTIPNSVTSIGYSAFEGCSGLTSLTIPKSMTSIEDDVFSGCSGLTSIKVENGNTVYDSRNNCNAIIVTATNELIYGCQKTVIPNSVTSIGGGAFSGCSSLTSIIIPNSVKSIGGSAFESCGGLTSVTIPNSVTSIGERAFIYCGGLTSVTIGNSVTSIGQLAFYHCFGLTSITIPNSVTSIGWNAFYGCNLTSITIPSSVTSIDGVPFTLTNVTSIKVESGNTVYDSRENCNAIIKTENNELIMGCINTIIPNSVASIGYRAFSGCSSLLSITIPNSVTTIGGNAFSGCSGLTSITIPNSVTSIGNYAFQSCSGLTSFTIPNSVISIGNNVFRGCSCLTWVRSLITKPFAISIDCWTDVNKEIPLLVPIGMKKTYVDTEGWNYFSNIVEYNSGEVVEGDNDFVDFVDPNIKHICITNWDTNGDLKLSKKEAAAVTDLGNAFKDNKDIISFNELQYFTGLTSIGNYAFSGCSKLTVITIPESMTSIGSGAFFECSSLPLIIIPNSVTSIGLQAFGGCSSLTSFTIPESVTSIEPYVFSRCNSLTSITIPKTVKSIGSNAFAQTSLKAVNISDLEAWCKIKFDDNPLGHLHNGNLYLNGKEVKDLVIPSSVTSIENNAFSYGYSLTTALATVTIPNSVKNIGDNAFRGCKGMTEVYSMITEPFAINQNCWTNIKKTIPLLVPIGTKEKYESTEGWNYFTTILETNFDEVGEVISFVDSNVKAVCVANWDTNGDRRLSKEEAATVTDLGSSFKNNSKIKSFDELQYFTGLTSIGNWAFENCRGLTSITIPNSVTSIGRSAFSKCSGLTSVTIPNSVTSIGGSAFSGCSGLTSIVVESGNAVYDSRGDCNAIIKTETNELVAGCKNTIIPNSVTSIGYDAFHYCSGLTSVTIPSSATSIGEGAFHGCSGLTSVTIPNSVTSIGSSAFYGCSGLISVTIPNSVTSIEKQTFERCISLTSVTIPNSVTSIGQRAFCDCSGLTSVHISDLAAWCNINWGDNSANPLSYAHHLYLNGEEIKDIVIPNSVTSIGYCAFYGCSGLTSVTIPNSVTSIGDGAFCECSGLTSVTIPNSVTSIRGYAFSGCTGLTEVHSQIARPFAINSGVFPDIPADATLYVPAGTKETYKKTDGWNNFTNIVEDAPVAVTGMALNKAKMSLRIGSSAMLIVTVLPENATNKDVTWSTSDNTIATVETDGTVKGIKEGVATITCASVETPTILAQCTITVKDGAMEGDLNGDDDVDVTDVVELIDMVLAGIYDKVGDINGDGEVDVTDVVELIDMVLSGE